MPFVRMISAVAAMIAATAPAATQNWPVRPVTMVVPFAAGGGTDVLGRILSGALTEVLGQQVIIENVGGAGGMNGSARVARAAPDGYQFVLGSSVDAINQSLYKNPLYNPMTEFEPVVLIAEQPHLLVARKDLPTANLQEFIAFATANQAKMQYASAGVGSTGHLYCALLNAAIGINITHVPYRGGGSAIQDLIAGRTDYFCTFIPTVLPLIEGNLIKPIAVLTKNRAPLLPSLASADEQGLKDFDAYTWFAVFLPKRTPAPIVRKLHDATVAAMERPLLQDRLREIGAVVVAPERRSSEYLQKYLASEIRKWAAAIKRANIKAE